MAAPSHVILVDDDDSVRLIFARIITRNLPAIRLSVVPSGAAALTLYAAEGADLILTDYHMPAMDGLALATALREQGATVPIVLISGVPDLDNSNTNSAVTCVLSKSVGPIQLVAILNSLLPDRG